MCRIQVLDWACSICGTRGVNEAFKSSNYCRDAELPGHRQTCHETKRSADLVCGPCHAVGVDYFRGRRDGYGTSELVAVNGPSSDYEVVSHGERTVYYQNHRSQTGASKEEVNEEGPKKKGKKGRWSAKQKAEAAATIEQGILGFPQWSAEVTVPAADEARRDMRSETDAKASTSLNAEAIVFVPGAWRHGA